MVEIVFLKQDKVAQDQQSLKVGAEDNIRTFKEIKGKPGSTPPFRSGNF